MPSRSPHNPEYKTANAKHTKHKTPDSVRQEGFHKLDAPAALARRYLAGFLGDALVGYALVFVVLRVVEQVDEVVGSDGRYEVGGEGVVAVVEARHVRSFADICESVFVDLELGKGHQGQGS